MTTKELTLKVMILQEAINKMHKRMILLEDRIERLDRIKQKRPDVKIDLPIA